MTHDKITLAQLESFLFKAAARVVERTRRAFELMRGGRQLTRRGGRTKAL